MAQCKFCGRKGFFLSVNQHGLCNECGPVVANELQQRVRIIEDSVRLVDEGKKHATRLSRCDLVLEHTGALIKYEERGVTLMRPSATELYQQFSGRRDELIVREIESVVGKAREKAELARSSRSKVTALKGTLPKIRELGSEFKDPAKLAPFESNLRESAHKAELEGYLETARKAESKGNKKKALDQYQEALYFLQNDDISDDLQRAEIAEVEAKIKAITDTD